MGLLHDLGKLLVPSWVLQKRGPLTPDEWDLIHQHPTRAAEIIQPVSFLRTALDVPLYHHERWDGSGYPHGIGGDDIPVVARIFAVADVWDALTCDRPYRPAWSQDLAVDFIRKNAGSHFDPLVVEAFLDLHSTRLAG